ncbi:MAG: 50S ribosomal protein L15 [Deltaproteobacteria bacterium]|nr:50S ribosomal protein L15 [Deltaproteobacteria bacterium]
MMLDRLKAPEGATTRRKRIGRGEGSGWGRTSGRGNKGQLARTGRGRNPGFEGGQMPLQRRLPKRGFTNIFRVNNRIINVRDLEKFFKQGEIVDEGVLVNRGVLKSGNTPLKVLGNGELNIRLIVKANCFSASAKEKIEKAGGKAEVSG